MVRVSIVVIYVLSTIANGLQLKMISTSRPAILERLRNAVQYVAEQPVRLQYSTAMAARVGFFLSQGLIVSRLPGLASEPAASPTATPAPRIAPLDIAAVVGAITDALNTAKPDEIQTVVPLVSEKAYLESDEQRALFAKNFASIIDLMRRDMKNIETGVYKFPYDLTPSLKSPQWNPLTVATQVASYVTDRREVLARSRRAEGGTEIRERFSSNKYPDYFLQNFHFQTDGWLSSESAKLYDFQVESLFLGTADAMRRQLLPSMGQFFSSSSNGVDGTGVKHLDIATGTGRFLSFVMDNWPGITATALDLSPFYLKEAQNLLAPYPGVKFVEGNAEALPFPDASFDSISCVYMFHELPRDVRVKVVSEMARVLRPGGRVFFCDSAQKGEVPVDRVLEGFTIVAHEPYYLDYTEHKLDELFEGSGLVKDSGSEQLAWVSKCATFTKL